MKGEPTSTIYIYILCNGECWVWFSSKHNQYVTHPFHLRDIICEENPKINYFSIFEINII